MPGNFKKEDLRVLKTNRYLRGALKTTLEKKSFRQITVNDLCEEALISRAAFYSHFLDKFDLLDTMLSELAEEFKSLELSEALNSLLFVSKKWIKNLLNEADNETKAILNKFFLTLLDASFIEKGIKKSGEEYTIFISFCLGGLNQFLSWQIENDYSISLSESKKYLNKLLENFFDWDANNRNHNFRT